MREPLLEIRDVSKIFPLGGLPWRRRQIEALSRVSLTLQRGESLGIVGESGSGKSTLCRIVLGLARPTAGQVLFNGGDIHAMAPADLRRQRRQMQAIFQDTAASFNPRQSVRSVLLAPLEVHQIGTHETRLQQVAEALHHVGLDGSMLDRHPHGLSGGQRQRVAIARAILLRPSLVVADEPTSALDVSVQARILNLLREIRQELQLTYLFVSHNLGVIRYICDRVAVMYLGQVVEHGPIAQVFANPQHPYTRALVNAIPLTDPARRGRGVPLLGEVSSGTHMPNGCRFHSRCSVRMDLCSAEAPSLYALSNEHQAACFWHTPRFANGRPDWIEAGQVAHDGGSAAGLSAVQEK